MARFTVLALGLVACGDPAPPIIGAPWTAQTMQEPDGTVVRRLEVAGGALGTRLVLAGGISGGIPDGLPTSMEVLTFDTLGDPATAWGALPPLPVAWTHANLAVVGDTVYVLGGLVYDPQLSTFFAQGEAFALEAPVAGAPPPDWTPITPLPDDQKRGASAIVISTGHIFLLGGATEFGPLDTILDFDVGTRTFTSSITDPLRLPRLLTPRSHAAAMRTFDGTFVIAGGLGDRVLGDVAALRPQTALDVAAKWELREPMSVSRAGCAYGVVFGQLICAGGDDGVTALDVVESYNPTPTPDTPGGVWTLREPMPEPRAGARGTVVANRLYVPGGSATLEFEPTASLFVFSPLPF